MTRNLISFIYALLLSLPLTSCNANEAGSETPVISDNGENTPLINETRPIPDGYGQDANEQGKASYVSIMTRETMRKARE